MKPSTIQNISFAWMMCCASLHSGSFDCKGNVCFRQSTCLPDCTSTSLRSGKYLLLYTCLLAEMVHSDCQGPMKMSPFLFNENVRLLEQIFPDMPRGGPLLACAPWCVVAASSPPLGWGG